LEKYISYYLRDKQIRVFIDNKNIKRKRSGGGKISITNRIYKKKLKDNRINQTLAGGTGFVAKLCELEKPWNKFAARWEKRCSPWGSAAHTLTITDMAHLPGSLACLLVCSLFKIQQILSKN